MSTPRPSSPAPDRRMDRLLPLAGGLVALAPLLISRHDFARLFWLGDEFDLIDQIDHLGLWRWIWVVFAENFVPLFKLLWGGSVFLFHGSYLPMIVMLWLTHAVNTWLLGRLLRVHEFPWTAVIFAQLIFALSPGNMETLGWSVQWSAVLATTFFLLALDCHARHQPHLRVITLRGVLPLVGLCAGSAFCFARGVLTGAVLGVACFWPPEATATVWRRRLATAGLCLLPALVAGGLIAVFASGNHKHLAGHLLDASQFGLWYYCLSPLHRWLEMDTWGPHTTASLGLLKLTLTVWGLKHATARQRALLVLLVLYDLGNVVLLGVGRYHTGLSEAINSRYQYGSILSTIPFVGLWLSHLCRRFPVRLHLRPIAATAIIATATWFVARSWPDEIRSFCFGRGTENRRILLVEPNPGPYAVPGIPFMPTSRGKELIKKYHLH